MGASSSKSEPQLWKGTSPSTTVSHDIIESLQSSQETDFSRSQTLELQVQARVAEELRKIQSEEAQARKRAQEKLSELPEKDTDDSPSRFTVSKEIADLRARLEAERKKVRQLPDSVEAAQSEVVRCLRENDRRPLDCWKEVASFKEEVRKLEKEWVEKVVS